jgi:hypothetical protein
MCINCHQSFVKPQEYKKIINVHEIKGNGLRQDDKNLMESKCVLGYPFFLRVGLRFFNNDLNRINTRRDIVTNRKELRPPVEKTVI